MGQGHNALWINSRRTGCMAHDPGAFSAKRHDLGVGWYVGKLLGEIGFNVLP